MTLNEIKEAILKKRRQRIRKTTYSYVAAALLEDIAPAHPFRDRMVIDWWSRVIDPLEAEDYDERRLTYFRKCLSDHRKSASHNARVRQGTQDGKELRRLNPLRLAYITHQVRRLSDRRLNYAAVKDVYDNHNGVFRALAIGLLDMDKLKPGPKGFVYNIINHAKRDARFQPLLNEVREEPGSHLPNRSKGWVNDRLEIVDQPLDLLPPLEDTYWEEQRQDGLIRAMEEKYIRKLNNL